MNESILINASEQTPVPAPTSEPTPETTPRTLTIKVPRVHVQSILLGLIALVTIFQTVQIYGLKTSSAKATVKTSVGTPSTGNSAAPAAGSSNSALPEMVGGC